jgi:hypothetical protein
MLDPVEEPQFVAQRPLALATPIALAPPVAANPPKPLVQKDTPDFIRTHWPINKAIEAVLDKLPEPLIELLSQDMSSKAPDWDPPHGLPESATSNPDWFACLTCLSYSI